MKLAKIKERNKTLILLYNTSPNITMAEIGQMFAISKQRVSRILKKYKTTRDCSNCLHFQEFKSCSCRSAGDIIKTANRCPDWTPEGVIR
jgi:hypothetical protein